MIKQIGSYEVELSKNVVYIRDIKTRILLKAKEAKPGCGLDLFNQACKMIGDKFGINVKPVLSK